MIYEEKRQDLFSGTEEYHLAHCISADFAMGAGIVVQFNKLFDMKNRITASYSGYLADWQSNNMQADCILIGRVFNLITKERHWHKPTYASLQAALELMRDACREQGVRRLAMPLIGCGLDGLSWEKVSPMVQRTFADMDIKILVCRWE